MRKSIFITLVAVLIIVLLLTSAYILLMPKRSEKFSVASWNLQVFGDKKSSDPKLLKLYADKIGDYDIVVLQEIRDADGSAPSALCAIMSNYSCVISSRAGRTSSKEQYLVAYKKGIVFLGSVDYNPSHYDVLYNDTFERPPYLARFAVNGTNLTIITIHISPEDAKPEIAALEKIVVSTAFDNEPTIIIGDLNADCNYYDVRHKGFASWSWAIADDVDTTVAQNSCAYDRILLDDFASDIFIKSGVDSVGIIKDVSDHYLVWASFS